MKSSRSRNLFPAFFYLTFCILLLASLNGCVRLAGGTGYYYEKDGTSKSGQAGFDTNELLPEDRNARVTSAENV